MASTRSVKVVGIFASLANTVIPPTPIQGVAYRNNALAAAGANAGWPYAVKVNSADYNQILYSYSTLLAWMESWGVVGYTDLTDYAPLAVVMGSDNKEYICIQANGPTTAVKDPTTQPTYWVLKRRTVIPRAVAAGTVDVITVDFVPDATPLVDGDLVQIQHTGANTVAPTINPDGAGALGTYKGANTPLVAGDIPGADYWGLYIFDASLNKLQMINPATGVTSGAMTSGIAGLSRGLQIDAVGVNNYTVNVAATEVVLENSTNQYFTVRGVALAILANGVVGNPLSIMSARAASTWYYIWLWRNAAGVLTGTLDVSPTAPTTPAGYAATDFKARLNGAVRTDASGSTWLLNTRTRGNVTNYCNLAGSNTAALPIMGTGNAGNVNAAGGLVSVAVAAFVPPTAVEISVPAMASSGGSVLVGANNNYGATGSTTNMALASGQLASGVIGSTVRILLESANIWWAGVAPASIWCLGWVD